MASFSPRRRVDVLSRLVDSGWFDVAVAGLLAVLVVLLDGAYQQAWQVLLLDLAACLAAALTGRWPRAAGLALAGVLSIYLFIPDDWATMGEYAPLIPILGTGMRGQARLRRAMTLGYFLLLAAIAWRESPSATSAVLAAVVWAVFIAILWLIGDAFRAVSLAQEQLRSAELRRQRQAVARELHDTVARSLGTVILTANRSQLRGEATPADLERIARSAEASLQELRLVMSLLRDSPAAGSPVAVRGTPLTDALVSGTDELRSAGFTVTLLQPAEPVDLPAPESEALGAAAREAIANVLKHGDPALPCAVVVEDTASAVELTFVNGCRPGDDPPRPDALGLWGLGERLAAVGGRVSAQRGPNQWITVLTLPRRLRTDVGTRLA
ncbi:MAG: histidine kinase [Propionicimonas sp.]|nr:histidine kinase [Propionicimonas sp.]